MGLRVRCFTEKVGGVRWLGRKVWRKEDTTRTTRRGREDTAKVAGVATAAVPAAANSWMGDGMERCSSLLTRAKAPAASPRIGIFEYSIA